MFIIILKNIFVFIAFVMLGRCDINSATLTLSQDSPEKEYNISRQTEIVVTLDANPTTGYSWTITGIDTTILKQIEEVEFQAEPQKPSPPGTKKLGAPGKQIFRFQSISAGKTILKLIYHRPWEKEVAPADTFQVTFNIAD